MANLKQSTAYTRLFLMIQSSDHVTGLTGATPVVTLSKAGAAPATAGGTVSEVTGGNGWYKVALTTGDTGTIGDLAFHCTATSGDPTDFVDQVSLYILGDAFPITANIKQNTTSAGFMFVMTDSTNHFPATGLTVTATRSIDGAAFASCTNSVSEVANGTYKIDLSAADVNGRHIMLRFTATGADDLNIEIITQP